VGRRAPAQDQHMIVRRVLFLAIILSSAIFTLVGAAQNATVALVAATLGVVWLFQEMTGRETLNSLYFLVFAGLAGLGALGNASLPFLLLGLAAALVAWDLSRFRRRIREEEAGEEKTRIERAHLQKLGIAVAGGFVIALLPVLVTISLNFVVLLVLMLIVLLALRQSMLSLRGDRKNPV
ncbi:MAG: hypothetical protein ABI700_06685, partial [Chloroflexota bacterium]